MHLEVVRSESGAPSEVVTALLQDRSRFIWIGSREGLSLFDGYSFIFFTHDPSDPASISDNAIRTLFEDSHGDLWIGTNTGGLNRLDRGRRRFDHYRHDSADPASLSHDSVYAIVEDPDGALWVATQQGLNRMDPATGRFESLAAGVEGALGSYYVAALACDTAGYVWAGTVGGGLSRIDRRTRRATIFRHDRADPRSLGSDNVFALMEDASGRFWVGTEDGLYLMDRDVGTFRRLARMENHGPGPLVTSLARGPSGSVWVGTHGDGLFEADAVTGRLHSMETDAPASAASGARRVISLLTDQDGTLWIGTWGWGLSRLTSTALRFARAARDISVPEGAADLDVTALGTDSRGGVWVGTRSGILLRKNGRAGWEKHVEKGSSPTVFRIVESGDGGVWAGTSAGLLRIDPASGGVTHYRHVPADPRSIGPGYVPALLEDREGNLWIGTGEGGVQQLDRQGRVARRFVHDARDPTSLSDNYVTVLASDRRGTLWAGTRSGGLNAIDPIRGQVTRYMPAPGRPGALAHHYVTSLHEDSKRRLWIGTGGGGLHRLDGTGSSGVHFTRYSVADGLIDDNIMAILEDDDGSLWLSTKRGLCRLDPDRRIIDNYYVPDGLPSAEFEPGAAARTSHTLLFGSVRWAAAFPAGTTQEIAPSAPVAITSVRSSTGDHGGGRPVAGTERIEIPYGEWISIELAVLDFGAIRSHTYAYRLDRRGEWIEMGSRREITFSKLSPGTYEFAARGRGRQAVWSETTPALTVSVIPPFWMTSWFRALAGIGLLAAALVVHRVRLSALRRRNRDLVVLQEQREHAREELGRAYDRLSLLTRRLEAAKEEERKRIARELHDEMGPALTAVVINLQLLGENADQAKSSRRVADAIEIVDRMVQKIRDVSLDLRPPLLDEMGLVPALKGYLETQAERAEIEIEVRGEPEVTNLPPEVEITAFRVAQEAVTNIIRHASARRAVVTVARADGRIEIRVEDDGRGFDVRNTMEATATGKAIGLLGMQERVRMLGGEFHIDSTPGGGGTRIRARLPLKVAA